MVLRIICWIILIIYPLCVLPVYLILIKRGYKVKCLYFTGFYLMKGLVNNMPCEMVIKLEKMKNEIPHMTAKADALNREADILDARAEKEVNEFKECRLRSQAASKRLQADRIISDVELRLNKLKSFGSILEREEKKNGVL
jgi:hypothetical protein